MKLRRVVTGNSETASTVIFDGPSPKVFRHGAAEDAGESASYIFGEVWATDSGVPECRGSEDITEGFEEFRTDLAPGQTRFRLVQFPAGMDAPMHATPTIDYIAVLDGEIDLELEDGTEVHLTKGDAAVQRGVKHAWHNRSDKPFQMAVVMIGTDLLPDV